MIANFADFLVLLHLYLCSETISTECIPSVWINLVDYVSDISNNDELKMLFISRYTMKNKNKKLNSNNKMLNTSMSWLRIENYYAEFNFKDSENTMSRILKIFEYSFSPNRRGEEGWILSEADMKEKLLHDFENTADVNQTGSIIIGSRNTNIKCLTPQASNILSSVRANAKEKLMEFFVCFEKTSTNALQLEERFMNRLKCDPNILEDLCLVIFKVSNPYKEMYGTNLIVNITFEEIFKAISISEGDFPDQRFNVELYEELTQLADHATNELIKQKLDIYYSSKRAGIEMYNKPLVDKDLAIDVEDMSLNSSLSIANCCALQFFNKLFIRICYEWNIIPENSKCCSSSGFANKYDGMFFPPGSTSEQIHWDYQTPVPDGLITPSSEFYGASLIVNSSSVSQIFQVHQWETQEFSSRKFTLKTFIRSAFSLTIIDGRLLHNEMENTSTWNYFSIIHADPANFSYANERKPIKLLSNSERNDGVSVVFQLNNNNITVEKVLGEGDRRNKSDDIMALLTVKENLSSMMEDVDLGEINWHMDNLLQQIRKRPRL